MKSVSAHAPPGIAWHAFDKKGLLHLSIPRTPSPSQRSVFAAFCRACPAWEPSKKNTKTSNVANLFQRLPVVVNGWVKNWFPSRHLNIMTHRIPDVQLSQKRKAISKTVNTRFCLRIVKKCCVHKPISSFNNDTIQKGMGLGHALEVGAPGFNVSENQHLGEWWFQRIKTWSRPAIAGCASPWSLDVFSLRWFVEGVVYSRIKSATQV